MTHKASRAHKKIASQTTELAIAVPQVVAHRVSRMAMAGPVPSSRDRKEFTRMVAEKQTAFSDAWRAMFLESLRANQALATSMMRSFWSPSFGGHLAIGRAWAQAQNAGLSIVAKGVAPVHLKAVSNAKRLSRTKLR